MFLMVPQTKESISSSGYPTITHREPFEYISLVIKSSILIMLAFIMLIYIKEKKKVKEKTVEFSLYVDYVVLFIIWALSDFRN